jgi:hypothetical protein
MSSTHAAVVVVADDGVSPVGTDEWNAGHVGLADTLSEPTVDTTIAAGYSAVLVGLPLIVDSGRLLTIAAGAVLVIQP